MVSKNLLDVNNKEVVIRKKLYWNPIKIVGSHISVSLQHN